MQVPLTRDRMRIAVLERHLRRVWSESQMAGSICSNVRFKLKISMMSDSGLSCELHATSQFLNTSSTRLAFRRRLGAGESKLDKRCNKLQPVVIVRHKTGRGNNV